MTHLPIISSLHNSRKHYGDCRDARDTPQKTSRQVDYTPLLLTCKLRYGILEMETNK
jgi:hypothetical protein